MQQREAWREAFVAMCTVIEESSDFLDADDLPFLRELRNEDKTVRTHALARALGVIAVAIESLEIELP